MWRRSLNAGSASVAVPAKVALRTIVNSAWVDISSTVCCSTSPEVSSSGSQPPGRGPYQGRRDSEMRQRCNYYFNRRESEPPHATNIWLNEPYIQGLNHSVNIAKRWSRPCPYGPGPDRPVGERAQHAIRTHILRPHYATLLQLCLLPLLEHPCPLSAADARPRPLHTTYLITFNHTVRDRGSYL